MKTLTFIAGLLVATTAVAQLPPPEATQAETDAGVIGSKYISPRRGKNASWAGSGGGGVSAATATNIAAYQAQIATNGLALGSGVTVAQLAQSNYIPRVLISDTTPQDPYRWINATNGLIRFPAWSSDRIVGSLTPGIHFYSVTNGADHFSIDVQHDHAAAGKSEARMIFLWDGAIVPGYNSGVQLGASTDNYNQEFHIQYANRMGWSHLFNFRGNTNGNIGSISLQGRRISTTTNLSELWIWANEPTWNTYPTPGFSATGPQIAKLAIGGTYFYSDLYTPRTIVTNRQLVGAGPMFYTTDGGLELSSGYSDGFMVGGDLGAATRTTTASKYFWMTMVPKTHSDPRQNILSVANDSSTTATLYIGGGSSAVAPLNRVKIYAGADSTATGTGSLGVDVASGQVTTTNLTVNGTLSAATATLGTVTISNLVVGGTITGNGSGVTNVAGFNTNIAGAGMISNSSPVLTFNGSNVFAGPVFFGGNVTVGNGLPSYFSNLYTTNFTIFSNTPPAAPLTYGEVGFYVSNGVPYVMDSSLSGAHTWLTTNRFGSSPQQVADSLGGLPMNGSGITNLFFGAQTNGVEANLAANKVYRTNMTAAITLAAFANVPSTTTWGIELWWNNTSGGNLNITCPNGVIGESNGFPAVIVCTNNSNGILTFKGYAQVRTNVYSSYNW